MNIYKMATSLIPTQTFYYKKYSGGEINDRGIKINTYDEPIKFKGRYITNNSPQEKKDMAEFGKYDAYILTDDIGINVISDRKQITNDIIIFNNYEWRISGIADHRFDNGWIRIYIYRGDRFES